MPAVFFALLGAFLLLPSPLLAAPSLGASEAETSRPKASKPNAKRIEAPWRARSHVKGRGIERGYGLIDPENLPPEPESPQGLSLPRFTKALHTVCDQRIGKKTARRYARWISKYSAHFQVDPYLLSAFIRRQSGCLRKAKGKNGVGLSRIPHSAHAKHIREGHYHYQVWDGVGWQPLMLDVSKFPWSKRSLRRAESAIYFAAALLSVYSQQAESLDKAFRQFRHRHPISHLVWGDRVRGNDPEERILRDRRRMIAYYTGKHPKSKGNFRGRRFRLPLDGAPRKITSGWHGRRGKRKRRMHRALDFYSHIGEPVRAIDDGRVRFAGYQRRRGRARKVKPEACLRVGRRWMGIGGLFVTIDHKGGLQSGYFHLRNYTVRSGQRVKKGQLIGYVGRTGIKKTRPHLHFDLRRVRKKYKYKINAEPYFGADAITFARTYVGDMVRKGKKRRRARLYAKRKAEAKRRWARRYAKRKAKAKRRRALTRATKLKKRKARQRRSKRSKLRRKKRRQPAISRLDRPRKRGTKPTAEPLRKL